MQCFIQNSHEFNQICAVFCRKYICILIFRHSSQLRMLEPFLIVAEDSDDEEIPLTEEEKKASTIVEKANQTLEKLEEKDALDLTELKAILAEFDEALSLDPNSIDAMLGKGYVLGLGEEFDKGSSLHCAMQTKERASGVRRSSHDGTRRHKNS